MKSNMSLLIPKFECGCISLTCVVMTVSVKYLAVKSCTNDDAYQFQGNFVLTDVYFFPTFSFFSIDFTA